MHTECDSHRRMLRQIAIECVYRCMFFLSLYRAMVDVEKLISFVKNYPILYDLDNAEYKNVSKKDKVWYKIGLKLGESGNELKKKWKNLRDCYSRHIRSEKSTTPKAARSTRYYKSWRWAKQMEVFKPFLKFAQTKSKVQTDLNESSESTTTVRSPSNEESCQQPQQNDTLQPTAPSRKRKHETESSVDKNLTYLQEKRKTSEVYIFNLNATEHMFLGLAKTITTFSARRQASVKMRIANIVLEEELLQAEEEQNALQSTSTSLSGNTQHSGFANQIPCPS